MTPDFHTGRYALYIWPAFGLSAVALAWMVADSLWRARRWRDRAERRGRK